MILNLRQNLIDIFKYVAFDEPLNRMLYHKIKPLDISNPDVTSMKDFPKIQDERIIRSPKTSGLTDNPICRICMYIGARTNQYNMKMANQDIVFDVYAHIDEFDSKDARSLMICDRINEIIQGKHITGVGKMESYKMFIIGNAPSGYIGYKMVFSFGSVK